MRTENWNGRNIRFIEVDGEWYAILKDICDALGLRVAKVSERMDPDMLIRVSVPKKHLTSLQRTLDPKEIIFTARCSSSAKKESTKRSMPAENLRLGNSVDGQRLSCDG